MPRSWRCRRFLRPVLPRDNSFWSGRFMPAGCCDSLRGGRTTRLRRCWHADGRCVYQDSGRLRFWTGARPLLASISRSHARLGRRERSGLRCAAAASSRAASTESRNGAGRTGARRVRCATGARARAKGARRRFATGNRRAEAREPLRAALELARHCGARTLEEDARELAATGARPRRVMRSGIEALTPPASCGSLGWRPTAARTGRSLRHCS
jgi:hypothetical protein